MADERVIHGGPEDTAADTERALRKKLAEVERERDEALRFKWSVEDAVIAAVPARLAELRKWMQDNPDAEIPEELGQLIHAPFDEPIRQTLEAESQAAEYREALEEIEQLGRFSSVYVEARQSEIARTALEKGQ